ncbi:MAG: hypothetical protein V4645_07235 [Pseudomonadota bacterium]
MGELESGFTYIPIDPFPVGTIQSDSCKENPSAVQADLLSSLPDNAVRMLIERFDVNGTVVYGVGKVGVKDERYRVTIDYINADTVNVRMGIRKTVQAKSGGNKLIGLFAPLDESLEPGTESFEVMTVSEKGLPDPTWQEFNIPVYIGVGLRVSANIYITGTNVSISGIGAIGAEADAQRLKGSLVVQTLGINGKLVAAALPIQSELNRTTAENAIVSVSSIKTMLYSDETIKSPRVVGIYLPFPGGKPLVNRIISELSKTRPGWPRPCVPPTPRKS